MRKAILLLFVVCTASLAHAQDAPLWSLWYKYGKTDFQTPILKTGTSLGDMTNLAEIGISRRLTKFLSLAVPFRLGTANLPIGTTQKFTSDVGLLGADVLLQAMPAKYNWRILPYLTAGLGIARLDKTANLSLPVGAGLNFKIADGTYLNFESQYRKGFTAQRDHFMHKLGLVLFLDDNYATDSNKAKEISEAAEKLRLETEAKARAAVDAANRAKAEAEAKAAAEIEAANKAKLAAEAKAKADLEAVNRAKAEAEAKAKAAAEAAAKAKTPDVTSSMGDALANARNKDTDGDGVLDATDKCPTVKGTVANNGCPEEVRQAPVVTVETQKVLIEALEGVQFETGSAVLKPVSYAILDKVASVMKNNANYNLAISGHTDATGNEAANQKLSQKRAQACLSYLVTKGIAASRMTATGYGSTQPIMDNKTPEGRAKNRRVEFRVF